MTLPILRNLWPGTDSEGMIVGRYFTRREPVKGDEAANVVRVAGLDVLRNPGEGVEAAVGLLIVQSATFGGRGTEWDGPDASYRFEDFDAEYRPADDAEIGLLASTQRLESIATDEALEKARKEARRRDWDWTYNPKTKQVKA